MKKLLRVLFIICLLAASFSLVGCAKPYKGKDISSISFVSVDFMSGASKTTTFDFDNAVASVVYRFPYHEELDWTKTYPLDKTKRQQLFDDLNKCGFFKLKELYKQDNVIDGGSNSITVNYADGTTFESECVNESNGIEEKYGIAFYDFCGEYLVGYVPEIYMEPPMFETDFTSYTSSNGSSGLVGGISVTNYNWHNKKVDGISLAEATADAEAIKISEYGTTLSSNASYQDVKPNKITIYSYDLDGNGKQKVFHTISRKEFSITLEKDKIYQIIATYKYGTAEYVFCTQAEAE